VITKIAVKLDGPAHAIDRNPRLIEDARALWKVLEMKLVFFVLIAASLALAPAPVLAQRPEAAHFTIGELRRECLAVDRIYDDSRPLSRADAAHAHHCLGFIQGFVDGATLIAYARPPALCGSFELSIGQLRDLFVGWATRHPEDWDDPAALGLLRSITDSCQR
jgi:hypothetical protein